MKCDRLEMDGHFKDVRGKRKFGLHIDGIFCLQSEGGDGHW